MCDDRLKYFRPIKTEVPEDKNQRSRQKWKESQEEKRRQAAQSKLNMLLFRHKELLKKDIMKKRTLLEKELQIEVQREVTLELNARAKNESKAEEIVRTGSGKRKSAPVPAANIQPPKVSGRGMAGRPKKSAGRVQSNSFSPPSSSQHSKKEKLYCICRTPYDDTKYV